MDPPSARRILDMTFLTPELYETLELIVLAPKQVPRDLLNEEHVVVLAKLQLVDWGRKGSPDFRQTIPSTVISTWRGDAVAYKRMFLALHDAASKVSTVLGETDDEMAEYDALEELDAELVAHGCKHPESLRDLGPEGTWACKVCGYQHTESEEP
jgi:rubrerythrin